MKKAQIFALALALSLLFCTISVAGADTTSSPLLPNARDYPGFADVKGTWCEDAVKTVYETGLMNGSTAADFSPAAPLSNAQAMVLVARFYCLFSGEALSKSTPWYQSSVDLLMAHPEVFGELDFTEFSFQANCTRYIFTSFLGVAIPEDALTPLNDISAVPDLRDVGILALYRAGVVTGTDSDGALDANAALTRGQTAAMLARVVDPTQRQSLNLKPFHAAQDIFGLDPDTILVTVDGYPMTAEDMLDTFQTVFSSYVTPSNTCDLCEEALRSAVLSFAKFQWVLFDRAAQAGIALTAAQRQEAEVYGHKMDGALGRSRAYHQRNRQLSLLTSNLFEKHPGPGTLGMSEANVLANKWATAAVATTTPAFDRLDIKKVYEAMQSSPLKIHSVDYFK